MTMMTARAGVLMLAATAFASVQQADASQDISASEYWRGLVSFQTQLQQSKTALSTAETTLSATRRSLSTAETALRTAEEAFSEAESSGGLDALNTAWTGLHRAQTRWAGVKDTYDSQSLDVEEAEDDVEVSSIWFEQFKNDYEAQSKLFAVRDQIARCKTNKCSATSFLNDERFTVFQPHVLDMVGVHYAYAQGLTGKGVRLGIEDDIVNYTLPEFAGRISFAGASLTYPVLGEADYTARCGQEGIECGLFSYSVDLSKYPQFEALAVRWIIASNDWPDEGERWFLRNDHYEEDDLQRWAEIPHATSRDWHGTSVASVAAGRDFGVAPGATVIPIATDFSSEGLIADYVSDYSFLQLVSTLSDSDRRAIDSEFARRIASDYAHYDIINRSFGIGVFDPASIDAVLNDGTQWWGKNLRRLLPEMWRAYMQTGTDPDDRTVVVYAAGNHIEEFSGLGADIPFYEPHVRGSQLSVMALGHDGAHALYTNFCGALPSDWDAGRWGRHFCLAAPGTVNSAASAGKGYFYHEIDGTSFAAPVVAGAIALLMEHFRGQLGNTEIVKRVVNTANNQGRYAQLEIYGAGLLDLKAALSPVGRTVTGTASQSGDAMLTRLFVPQSMGALGPRLASKGVEVASLDSLGAPFWSPPMQFVHTIRHELEAIPTFSEPEQDGYGQPHLGFTPDTLAGPVNVNGLHLLLGANKLGLEQAPRNGFRWGILGDGASWQGGRTSGAFGDRVRSMTAWAGRSTRFKLDDKWSLNASATLALGRALFESGSMLDAGAHVLSTWDLGVERGVRGRGTWSRLALSQPLRAESGKGTFTYLAGLKDGSRVYEEATVSLAPEGRELEFALTHETPIGRGRGVFKVAHSWDARHEPGRTGLRVGVAYRLNW